MLEDISSDGRLLLFYETNAPMRTFHFPLGAGKGTPDQPDAHDVLRVVELASGREAGRKVVGFLPYGKFISGMHKVIYAEYGFYKVWDPGSAQTQECLDPRVLLGNFTFLDQQRAYGFYVPGAPEGDSLVQINLADCSLIRLGPVDPIYISSRTSSDLALSPDKKFLAYVAGDRLLIWDIEKKQVSRRLGPDPSFFTLFGREVAYTPDGKFLISSATDRPYNPGKRYYLVLYDSRTYQVVKRIEVPGTTAMAVSCDGSMIAVGYGEGGERGDHSVFDTYKVKGAVVLYDVGTGKEIGRASHRSAKRSHNDPFAGAITGVAFTPNGKYLLSSTYDTRVWQIENHAGH